MNIFYRVDNRLVHGQIISTWMPHLRPKMFVIVNDSAPSNELQMAMFRMAIPNDIELKACTIEDAVPVLNALRHTQTSVLVLLETVEDAAKLFSAGHAFSMLNIGNVHHMPGRRSFTNAVFLGDSDVDTLRNLFSRGVHVEIRTLPKEIPIDLKRAIEAA